MLYLTIFDRTYCVLYLHSTITILLSHFLLPTQTIAQT